MVEIILKEFVEGLGAEADFVKVKPGFARNYLLPRGKAILATSTSRKQIDLLKKRRAEREAEELNHAQELAGKLAKLTLTFQMQTGEGSRLFGSVTAHEIVSRLEEMGHKLDKKSLVLAQPLKTLGESSIPVNLKQGVQSKIKVILAAPTQAEDEIEAKDGKKAKGHYKKAEKGERASKGKEGKEVKAKKEKSSKA